MARDPNTRTWFRQLLRTPLLTKLVLLDLSINVLAFLALQRIPDSYAEHVTIASLGLVLVLNAALVAWALRPLRVLEDTARRVSRGEFGARTAMPALADRNLVRIADTLDGLLDHVVSERERVRRLAAQVIAVGDQERARIARELHDRTAQSLSALDMLLTSTLAESSDDAVTGRLEVMREIVAEALREVRTLCHEVHPRVLEDLGLAAALESLARRSREQAPLRIRARCAAPEVPLPVASVLYRVAQEAVHNAIKHAEAHDVVLELQSTRDAIVLEVRDDGRGFDREEIDRARRGMGLFVMQERVALVDGDLRVTSRPGQGTQVRARVPLPRAAA